MEDIVSFSGVGYFPACELVYRTSDKKKKRKKTTTETDGVVRSTADKVYSKEKNTHTLAYRVGFVVALRHQAAQNWTRRRLRKGCPRSRMHSLLGLFVNFSIYAFLLSSIVVYEGFVQTSVSVLPRSVRCARHLYGVHCTNATKIERARMTSRESAL